MKNCNSLDVWNDLFDLRSFDSIFKNNHQYDVIENDNEFTIEFALAGISKENIDIDIDKNMLVISAERKEKEVKYNYRSINFGKLTKSFLIPDNVKVDQISSSHNDGILIIKLPKKSELIKKKIKID